MTSASSRSFVLFAAVALIAGFAAWQLFGSAGLTVNAEDPMLHPHLAVEPDVPVERPASELAELDEGIPARVEADERSPKVEQVTAEGPKVDAPEARVLLGGTVVLEDENGILDREISGELEFAVWSRPAGSSSEAAYGRFMKTRIEEGRFEARVAVSAAGAMSTPDGQTMFPGEFEELYLSLANCKLDGWEQVLVANSADLDTPTKQREFVAGATGAAIEVMPAPGLVLRVLDKATGNHLGGVEVLASLAATDQRIVHPRDIHSELLVDAGTSPLPVAPSEHHVGRSEVLLFVRADGCAWKGVTIDFSAPSQRTVELVPGGGLHLDLVGDVLRRAQVRLRTDGSSAPLTDIALQGARTLHLDGIAPATYEVTIEVGPWYGDPVVLGSAIVDVQPQTTATTTIELKEVEPAVYASIAGTLVLPPAWQDHRPRLRLKRVSASKRGASPYSNFRSKELKAVPGVPDEFTIKKSNLETGEYALSYGRFGYELMFDLPQEGRTDLRLEIPEPVELTVMTVDADTGEEVPDLKTISWHATRPPRSGGGTLERAERDATTGRFHFKAPRGSIDISTHASEYYGKATIADATHGLEFALEVSIRPSASVELRFGDQKIPWPVDHEWEVTPLDGDGRYNSSGSGGGTRWFGVSEPGRYSVAIPEIDGFLDHEPVEIELTSGKREHVIVELTAR